MKTLAEVRGFAPPSRAHFDREASGDGALFAGSPEEIATRIINLHKKIKHTRHFFQMDTEIPHEEIHMQSSAWNESSTSCAGSLKR